jgi:spore coat polysaccharide biosynthesis protein SpsF
VKELFQRLVPENGFVIGETACGHDGDITKLKKLIDSIADSKAEIIKFQIFVPLERATINHPEWQIFNDLALTKNEWISATEYARNRSLIIFADIFGDESFQIAKEIKVDGYKVHSEDLLNTYFIEKVAKTNQILLLGVGGAHRVEIYQLLCYLKQKDLCNNLILMPGVQTFPTSIESHSLKEVVDLKQMYELFGVKVGFADHISGDLPEAITTPLMAFAIGACVVEKHTTINRLDKWEDYESALNKEDFVNFVYQVKKLTPLLSSIGTLNSAEKKYRKSFKKTAIINLTQRKDSKILPEHISFVKDPKNKIPLSAHQLSDTYLSSDIIENTPLRLVNTKTNIGGIIVARCGSSRLPNKALLKIQERETIALLIERIKRCKGLDKVILATSTDPSDDILEEIAKREGVLTFRGSLENLSLRFYEAAKYYNLDQIVRITGDDILRDETIIDAAIDSHLYSSCNVTVMDNMPYGTASEIFSLKTLETILNTVQESQNTEYLEYYLENERYFSVNRYESNYNFDLNIRLTLDYEEDFEFFSLILDNLYPKNKFFNLQNTLDWLEINPKAIDINKHKTLKYKKSDLNLKLNI